MIDWDGKHYLLRFVPFMAHDVNYSASLHHSQPQRYKYTHEIKRMSIKARLYYFGIIKEWTAASKQSLMQRKITSIFVFFFFRSALTVIEYSNLEFLIEEICRWLIGLVLAIFGWKYAQKLQRIIWWVSQWTGRCASFRSMSLLHLGCAAQDFYFILKCVLNVSMVFMVWGFPRPNNTSVCGFFQ